MPEEYTKDKDPIVYDNLARSFEDILNKISNKSLTAEEKMNYMGELNSIWEKIKNLNPKMVPLMSYLKTMYIKFISESSKEAGYGDKQIIAEMHMGLQLFDEIYQEALILMKKEEKDFFEQYPELSPSKKEEDEDFDPRWKHFRDYYIQKLNDDLNKNKYEQRGMAKWKREAIVKYAFNKFNEIYRKKGDLTDKEVEAKKFYKKIPRTFKKFRKIFPISYKSKNESKEMKNIRRILNNDG